MTWTRTLAFLGAIAALAPPAASAAERVEGRPRGVTVMTRNLYVGTDLTPIFTAPTPLALAGAAGAGWRQAQANDFGARAEALADEIDRARPHVVGLQEAAILRTDVPADGPASTAEAVAVDYVDALLAALARRGLAYRPVATFTGTDAELPAGIPPAFDIRVTDRVVVLARARGVRVENAQSGAFATSITVPTAVGSIALPRGWASVDVKARGRAFRFVTTHLEAFSPHVRAAQMQELLAGPAGGRLPTVLVGDMNSGPGFDLGPYGQALAAGYADAWAGPGGATCCHGVDLRDPDTLLTKRIDLVLTRGRLRAVRVDVVGEEASDRTPGGLWPSDHAGVVATFARR